MEAGGPVTGVKVQAQTSGIAATTTKATCPMRADAREHLQ
jgi:hypothetical protein